MSMPPYTYQEINLATSPHTPSTLHIGNTALGQYYRRYLMQRAMSVYEWELPETWNRDYFLYTLYTYGYLAIVNTDKFGVIPQHCGLSGYNVFYQPTNAIISNPLLRGVLQPRIDTQCVLLKLSPDYKGISDKVGWYADLLALAMETATCNLVNSKLSFIMTARNKAHGETMKKMYDQIAAGNPAVVIDKDAKIDGEPWQLLEQNVGQNYIVSDVLSDMRKIEAMFDSDIGINNANTDKKERLITDEVNSNNEQIKSTSALWLQSLQEGCAKARDMFNIDISVDWRFGADGSNDVNIGPVSV